MFDADMFCADHKHFSYSITFFSSFCILRASQPTTPIKLMLIVKTNEPVRGLLYYILKYESDTQE